MPIGFLTDVDRDRLNRFPPDVPPGDLLTWFTLSDDALELIGDRRGEHNRVGFVMWTFRAVALNRRLECSKLDSSCACWTQPQRSCYCERLVELLE